MRVVDVHELSKRYRLGARRDEYGSLRESLAGAMRRPLRRRAAEAPELWALREVSFSVQPGETVGIVGRNGAGKSTLLKVLSRITRPSAGWAEVHGRVGSLLEVGTGFHPELTGRENVYLNGAIIGMRRADIARRFDEIAAFAEVDDFLDTPVKRYSSGMRVRLAFAVAAHLEPEVLIVDEVLAVGDLAFQRKCLGKMGEVTAEGRTVLFVSHNMAVIQTLCRRGILLERGSLVADAPVGEVVARYLAGLEQASRVPLPERRDRAGWRQVWLTDVAVTGEAQGAPLTTGAPARFDFELSAAMSRLSCAFTVLDHLGNPVMTLSSRRPGAEDVEAPAGEGPVTCSCVVDELPLIPGRYRLDVAVAGAGHRQDELEAAAFFDVAEGLVRGRAVPADAGPGPVIVPHRWVVPAALAGRADPAARGPAATPAG